jgi:hypothetical protein
MAMELPHEFRRPAAGLQRVCRQLPLRKLLLFRSVGGSWHRMRQFLFTWT